MPEGAYRLTVNLEVHRDEHDRKSAMQSYRLAADAHGPTLQKWVLSNGQERRKLASFSSDDGKSTSNGVEVALREVFEFRVPFALLGAQQGSRIRLRFAIWRDHLPVDSLPLEGWIDLFAVPEEELENNLYSFASHE